MIFCRAKTFRRCKIFHHRQLVLVDGKRYDRRYLQVKRRTFTAPVGWCGCIWGRTGCKFDHNAGARPAAAAPASSTAMPPVTLEVNPRLHLAGDGDADKRQRRQLQHRRLQRRRRQAELPEGRKELVVHGSGGVWWGAGARETSSKRTSIVAKGRTRIRLRTATPTTILAAFITLRGCRLRRLLLLLQISTSIPII